MSAVCKGNGQKTYSCPGERYKRLYQGVLGSDSLICLEETGRVDFQEEINSHALSCDINYILSRFRNGDDRALTRRQGVYADFSQMPSTYRDWLDLMIRGQDMFQRLPLDIKQKFGNSFERFVVSAGSKEWADILGLTPSAPSPEPAPAPPPAPAAE